MKGGIGKTWTGCVLMLALGVPAVHASTSGTITFVGAIVVPTCNVVDAGYVSPDRGYQRCAGSPEQASLPASVYRQDVASLEGQAHNDRLLAYFAGYAIGEHTQVVTRTYE